MPRWFVSLAICTTFAAPAVAGAKSWCAAPLVVHEWGVQVFDASGAATSGSVALPSYFHRQAGKATLRARVADLPADGGMRDLPVLHFYAPAGRTPVPLGLGVGFTEGVASAWFPQVDVLREANAANGDAACRTRDELVRARARRTADDLRVLGDDPTRQLEWRSLSLTPAAAHPPAQTTAAWVRAARAMNDALWVEGASESERFVFFEAKTRERVPLALRRGPSYAPGRRHVVLANEGAHPVHDVFVVHREGRETYVLNAPSIPAGAAAGFILEEHRVAPEKVAAATVEALRARLVDPLVPRFTGQLGAQTCVMGRDPAQPTERADGHTLYADEADLLFGAWRAALFERAGTTIVYREDPAYLDRVMPLSIFTDMFHFVELHRAGLAVWRDVVLPK